MSATSKIVSAIVIIVVVVGGIWLLTMRGPKKSSMPTAQQNISQPTINSMTPAQNAATANQKITVVLSAQNNSGETGTAILTDLGNGKTMVEVKIDGFPQGATQPEHIHVGSCANLGAVKYPLNPIMNGAETTTIDVSLSDLVKQLPLAINAHKSASEINMYTACGDLAAPGGSATAPTPAQPQPAPTPAPAPIYKAPASSGGGSTNYGY